MLEIKDDLWSENENGGTIDALEKELAVPAVEYDIRSYGADFDVAGLVTKLDRNDIVIPSFQRSYVWTIYDASRFIESLLLGLPVPSVFFAKEEDQKLLVIDGQQRLKTLQFFYHGVFKPNAEDKRAQRFRLTKVQSQFQGRTYAELDERDKRRLDDALIHAVIVAQESHESDDTSIHHIFERLNSKIRRLTSQEIRTVVDYGAFISLIEELNEHPNWRRMYGKKSHRLKDQELILRFFALYFWGEKYRKPMEEFLTKFSRAHRHANADFLQKARALFINTIDAISNSIGENAFRFPMAINVAIFDSVMVAVAQRLGERANGSHEDLKSAYKELLNDSEYLELVSESTSDENNVTLRMAVAMKKFSGGGDEEQGN